MRLLVLLLLPALAICAGQNKSPQKKTGTAPAAKQTATRLAVPAGAEQIGPNSWRHTDEKGQTWIYRKTPFGITRMVEAPPKPETELPAGLKAVQVGDEIRFERPGPFGPTRWSRKPDELTEIERKVWERDRPKSETPPDRKDTAKE
ncbi:MAG: hypothetical protein ACM3S5_01580 [Rhodospirillales bacterium]